MSRYIIPLVNPIFRATAYSALMRQPKEVDCRCDRFPAHPRASLPVNALGIAARKAAFASRIQRCRAAYGKAFVIAGIRAPLRCKCKMEKRVCAITRSATRYTVNTARRARESPRSRSARSHEAAAIHNSCLRRKSDTIRIFGAPITARDICLLTHAQLISAVMNNARARERE